MTRETLLELSDLNYAEALRELTRRAGGTVVDEDGILLFAGAHTLPVLCNGVMRTDTRRTAAEVLEAAHPFFERYRRGFSVLLCAHADEDLRAAAAAAGLNPMGDSCGMVLDHRLPDAAVPAGVTLRRVTDAADAATFADVMTEAYKTYGMPRSATRAIFGRPQVLVGPHIVSYLAFLDDTPVSGGMVIVTHGVAGVYWVGTTPQARNRGLGELCTRAAGNAGFDLGARIASLQASPMGEPIYRRMGYVAVTRYPYLVKMPERRA